MKGLYKSGFLQQNEPGLKILNKNGHAKILSVQNPINFWDFSFFCQIKPT
jgi:hypothetical protein